MRAMATTASFIEDPARGVRLEVLTEGAGDDVVLLPSSHRGAADFVMLSAALAGAGYRAIAVNPRGVGASTGPLDLSMSDIADDVAMVIEQQGHGPAHVVGHALGNTFARATASYRPEVVRSLCLLACGGHNLAQAAPPPLVMEHFARCSDTSLPDAERLESLGIVFFAPGNDASSWLDGWWHGGDAVSAALRSSDPEEWWRGGAGPMLIVQPLHDVMAPPSTGRELKASLGDRVRYVELADCGHAMLPEQPDLIAQQVLTWLADQP